MSDFKEKRRFNRIDLEAPDTLFLNLLKPDSQEKGHTVKGVVSNVSLRGCRVFFDPQSEAGTIVEGRLYIASLVVGGFSIPLTVQVLRCSEKVGAAIVFKPPFPKELEKLERFLEPRTLGMSLREINQQALQSSSSKAMRWFQGVNETHFFSWFDPTTGEVVHQQLIFLGHVVEWKKEGSLRTGRLQSDASSTEQIRGWVRSELMVLDLSANKDIMAKAEKLLSSANIDSATKNIFLNRLKE